MVTIWVLTRVSRSIRNGRRKVRPGWRTLVRSRPYRNTTPRSYCRTVCTEVASPSAAAATTARMTTVHKKVISSTPLRFRGPTHDPARHVRGEGIFVGHPAGLRALLGARRGQLARFRSSGEALTNLTARTASSLDSDVALAAARRRGQLPRGRPACPEG